MAQVLLVDDSMYQRTKLRKTLEAAGFEVIEGSDGEEGLSLAENGKPDCMVLDLIIGIYELAKEHLLYSPAADYNAVIYYDKSNGNITYVLFVHKPPKS